ncbi:helix-turn-helix transcriptional regulator [Paroceanicella profunda]|uniref:Helix-turn-helix transcriptional regulator n=2 Tax=Paroceanicella profunda TaxID=2579971 RepID=A0A5B8FT74_9RHOB|nr:helix-turn-helix transcriptional regulator [Paroceanicella profunda]
MLSTANLIDIHVGSRLRFRRLMVGMSQERLGAELGVTFQQVQKYEKGTNRIGASRLYEISRVLMVNVSYFFEGLEGDENQSGEGLPATAVTDFVSTSEGMALNTAFSSIRDRATRKRIVELVKTLAVDVREDSGSLPRTANGD